MYPAEYKKLFELGAVDPNSENVCCLYDMEWLPQDFNNDLGISLAEGLFAFAQEGGGNLWLCSTKGLVYFSELCDDISEVYADSFSCAIFKHLLEFCYQNNFSINSPESWEMPELDAKKTINKWLCIFESVLCIEWVSDIVEIMNQPLADHGVGYVSFISEVTYNKLISKHKLLTKNDPIKWCVD